MNEIQVQPVVYATGYLDPWVNQANFVELVKLLLLLLWSAGSLMVTVWGWALSCREGG